MEVRFSASICLIEKYDLPNGTRISREGHFWADLSHMMHFVDPVDPEIVLTDLVRRDRHFGVGNLQTNANPINIYCTYRLLDATYISQ